MPRQVTGRDAVSGTAWPALVIAPTPGLSTVTPASGKRTVFGDLAACRLRPVTSSGPAQRAGSRGAIADHQVAEVVAGASLAAAGSSAPVARPRIGGDLATAVSTSTCAARPAVAQPGGQRLEHHGAEALGTVDDAAVEGDAEVMTPGGRAASRHSSRRGEACAGRAGARPPSRARTGRQRRRNPSTAGAAARRLDRAVAGLSCATATRWAARTGRRRRGSADTAAGDRAGRTAGSAP